MTHEEYGRLWAKQNDVRLILSGEGWWGWGGRELRPVVRNSLDYDDINQAGYRTEAEGYADLGAVLGLLLDTVELKGQPENGVASQPVNRGRLDVLDTVVFEGRDYIPAEPVVELIQACRGLIRYFDGVSVCFADGQELSAFKANLSRFVQGVNQQERGTS